MKILYVSGVDGDTNRYRVDNPVDALRNGNINVSKVRGEEIDNRRMNSLLNANYDVIIFHRIGTHLKEFVQKAKKKDILVIYDIDDLIFTEEFVNVLERLGKATYSQGKYYVDNIRSTIKLFNHATCTTDNLKKSLHSIGVENVEIIPNFFHEKLLKKSKAAYLQKKNIKKQREKIIIGYPSGSNTHMRDLEIAVPALKKILRQYLNVEIHLLGRIEIPNGLKEFSNRITTHPYVPWMSLPELLADLDISIAPLENNLFCNSKSPLKYVESSLVCVPIVASSTKPFQKVIRQGITGFTASSTYEWYNYLKFLIENEECRINIGENAYVDVLKNFNSINHKTLILEVLSKWRSVS
ncbi:hypothetical protein C0966_05300 [Bacillus methanolicus]|uniref:glycosyltransferase n=1 Tax=Bacillus methanolicus TaxID=1471 RepID=UPI002380417E|nr:glycosyltransferase [Bacillus methanolicus]MDE3838796.1 hypothetical protein [Bacillus methanolicus]